MKAVGVLNTYLCTCSQMLAAWGDRNLLGMKFLSAQSRFGTPWVALVINSLLVAAGTVFSFQFLIQLDQLFYSIGLLLEYLSLLVLRYKVRCRVYLCGSANNFLHLATRSVATVSNSNEQLCSYSILHYSYGVLCLHSCYTIVGLENCCNHRRHSRLWWNFASDHSNDQTQVRRRRKRCIN